MPIPRARIHLHRLSQECELELEPEPESAEPFTLESFGDEIDPTCLLAVRWPFPSPWSWTYRQYRECEFGISPEFPRWRSPRRPRHRKRPGASTSSRPTKSVRWDWQFLFRRCLAPSHALARTWREIPFRD